MLKTIFWTTEEVVAAGLKIYEQSIRPLVEIPENIGKMLTLDVETSEYKLGSNSIEGAIFQRKGYVRQRTQAKPTDGRVVHGEDRS